MRNWMTVDAVHLTSRATAREIKRNGFDLQKFGSGAGAGSGEPAGVFVSLGDCDDFTKETDRRRLNMGATLHLRLHVKSVLNWDRDQRIAFFKRARIEFLTERFGISIEDANRVVQYSIRVMKERPDLALIADWLDQRDGERALALFLNQRLRDEGYDAVRYRDPWHGIEQMIVLDPGAIEIT